MTGKRVGQRIYLHVDALAELPLQGQQRVARARCALPLEAHFDVVRLGEDASLAFLSYPGFFDVPCPVLACSWRVDEQTLSVSYRDFRISSSPPILHRKELLLPAEHPSGAPARALSEQLERIGAFADPSRIGAKSGWTRRLAELGYELLDTGELVPLGNVQSPVSDDATAFLASAAQIERYRTALSRTSLSAPVQLLLRHRLLEPTTTFYDYGCGRGDDLRGLQAVGHRAAGWDPHYAAGAPIQPAAVVNLGFVLNVIEDAAERDEALRRAWSLAEQVLSVAVMPLYKGAGGLPFRDGVITSRSTFQKYYSQDELRTYLQRVTNETPVAVAPGIMLLFKDKHVEQRFLLRRLSARPAALPRASRLMPTATLKLPREPSSSKRAREEETRRTVLAPLWDLALELGRYPTLDEARMRQPEVETLGAFGRLSRLLARLFPAEALEQAAAVRRDAILVLLALQQFEKRTSYRSLEAGLQRDIQQFFGSYQAAQGAARTLLLQLADLEAVNAAAEQASTAGLGHWVPGESVQLTVAAVARLPALLRVLVGAATALYGLYEDFDLLKIHLKSHKVTFLRYDNFTRLAVPRLVRRVKIDLAAQHEQLFDYGDTYTPPPLYCKARYLSQDDPSRALQQTFDAQLAQAVPTILDAPGPSWEELERCLLQARLEIDGLALVPLRRTPALDEPCGRYLRYRDLVECGKTRAALQLPNLPQQPESWEAIAALAHEIIDPLIEEFGRIELTYGFCSPSLSRRIPARIDPSRDQHCAHELNRAGKRLCDRGGAAADVFFADLDMHEVADWIVEHLPFDRLYFYGASRPLHVSYGPQHARSAWQMEPTVRGALRPAPFKRRASPA